MAKPGKAKPTGKVASQGQDVLATSRGGRAGEPMAAKQAQAERRARHLQRPATERREFRAADADIVPAAIRRNPSRAASP